MFTLHIGHCQLSYSRPACGPQPEETWTSSDLENFCRPSATALAVWLILKKGIPLNCESTATIPVTMEERLALLALASYKIRFTPKKGEKANRGTEGKKFFPLNQTYLSQVKIFS